MTPTPELIALLQREREAQVQHDRLVRLAACARACCSPNLIDRVARTLRVSPTACQENAS